MRLPSIAALWLLGAAAAPPEARPQSPLEAADGEVQLGYVRDGQFIPLEGTGEPLRLTTVGMRDGQPPEVGEIDLSDSEGLLIAVTGHPGPDWMYSVEVREKAGVVVSGALQRLCGRLRAAPPKLPRPSGSPP